MEKKFKGKKFMLSFLLVHLHIIMLSFMLVHVHINMGLINKLKTRTFSWVFGLFKKKKNPNKINLYMLYKHTVVNIDYISKVLHI